MDEGSEIRIVFPLPSKGDFDTRLSQIPFRYWELEIKADVPGVDYEARFLLPVYGGSRPPEVL